ncbi:hypothetical protein HMPREF9700_01994 [Bergeyella zoohelcum CCUG 30536]|uniref:Uncharacterized protein n=1 Tax=Bergeyella zoohelcum TaxID=1015 RepID=A0A376C303_9FLAO|nr:hypothetical protein HMPREF9700_01994 [Bergeyella zoohelcum CCUG 30536]SSZ55875.1 Uncharacterised protein [Bergeyella zoohelcum]
MIFFFFFLPCKGLILYPDKGEIVQGSLFDKQQDILSIMSETKIHVV